MNKIKKLYSNQNREKNIMICKISNNRLTLLRNNN